MEWTSKSVKNLLHSSADDPIQLIRNWARNLVIEAFDKGWSGPPFNPIELSQMIGIRVIPNDDIQEARIYNEYKEFIIEYNPNQKESRINFSIAHEIGHTFFPDWKDKIRNRTTPVETESWELEFLCNIAASEILLPYAEFNNEANSVPLNLESILHIANKYKASVESVFLRFCEVVEKPCTIIIASFQDDEQQKLLVDYSKSSKFSSLNLERNFLIPIDSKAYDCRQSGWTSHSIENWAQFDLPHVIYSIGLPPVKKQTKNRVGLLLVPDIFPSEQYERINIVYGDATRPRGENNKIIAQVINTSGGLGFGFGKAMSKVWPQSKKAVIEWMKDKDDFELGHSRLTQLDRSIYVFQMIAQKGIFSKGESIPLRYDSLNKCLEALKDTALSLNASVHMPQIGAGQAKGNWSIIEGMIYDTLVANNVDVTIYVLPGTQFIRTSQKSNLSLFDQESLYEK